MSDVKQLSAITEVALTAQQIDELLSIRVTNSRYSNLNEPLHHLLNVGFVQRISGTDLYEVTERGELFMQFCGLKHAIHYHLNMKVNFSLSDAEYKRYIASMATAITFYPDDEVGYRKQVTNAAGGILDITDDVKDKN